MTDWPIIMQIDTSLYTLPGTEENNRCVQSAPFHSRAWIPGSCTPKPDVFPFVNHNCLGRQLSPRTWNQNANCHMRNSYEIVRGVSWKAAGFSCGIQNCCTYVTRWSATYFTRFCHCSVWRSSLTQSSHQHRIHLRQGSTNFPKHFGTVWKF